MEYYIYYKKEEEYFGRPVTIKPYRGMYPKMEIENFEDIEMEWEQKFNAAPEYKCHPNPRIHQYWKETTIWGQYTKGVECILVKICEEPTTYYRCNVSFVAGLDALGKKMEEAKLPTLVIMEIVIARNVVVL